MNKLSIVTGLLLILAYPAFSQGKKDKKVIATITDTSNIFNMVVRSLYESGYSLSQKDEQLGFIETDWRQLDKTAGKVKTTVLFEKDSLIFSSKYKLAFKSEFGEMEADISYGGAKGSDMRIYWEELVRLAKQFGTVTFSK
jgi:hypothetical protein